MEFYYLSERQHYFHYFYYFTTCLRGNTIFTTFATLLHCSKEGGRDTHFEEGIMAKTLYSAFE